MPDEIGWPSEEEEAMLDEARARADAACPVTAAYLRRLRRRCAAAERFRLRHPSPPLPTPREDPPPE